MAVLLNKWKSIEANIHKVITGHSDTPLKYVQFFLNKPLIS